MIIGSKYLFYKNLPSTNTSAASLLKKDNLPEGTIVYTNFQTAGRGYSRNKWESDDGKNLLISIVLYPTFIKPEDEFLISMTISLGIHDFMKRFNTECTIKWPNDIYIKNDKIAGILIDGSIIGNRIEYAIAGIGINLNQDKFRVDKAVSLKKVTGADHDYDIKESLELLASDLDNRYKQLISGEFSKIKNEYKSYLYRSAEWSEFRDKNGAFKGMILDVQNDGRILIQRQEGGSAEYYFKEVEFIP